MDATGNLRSRAARSCAALAIVASLALTAAQAAEAGQTIVLEAENYTQMVTRGSYHWTRVNPGKSSGRGAVVGNYRGEKGKYKSKSPRLDYRVKFPESGKYYLWIRTIMPSNSSNSIFVGLNNRTNLTHLVGGPVNKSYQWLRVGKKKVISVPKAGKHTLNVWDRESGMVIDQIILTKNQGFRPPGGGAALALSGSGNANSGSKSGSDSGVKNEPPSQDKPKNGNPTDGSDKVAGAVDDYATTGKGKLVRIYANRNDTGYDKSRSSLTIVQRPQHAKGAWVGSAQNINYRPVPGFVGRDRLVYRVKDNKGFSDEAVVTIDVGCNPCKPSDNKSTGGARNADAVVPVPVDPPTRAVPARIMLTWDRNPQVINGYRVTFGPSEAAAILQIANLTIASGQIDPLAPSHVIYPEQDLGLSAGNKVCFKVQAYNAGGDSGLSDAVCTTL